MNIYLTCYGLDTRNKEYINSYDNIIKILKNHIVAIIPNAKLSSQNKDGSITVKNELTKNNIRSKIVDLDEGKFNIEEFNAIYFVGGEPKYLMDSIIKNNYYDEIEKICRMVKIVIINRLLYKLLERSYIYE